MVGPVRVGIQKNSMQGQGRKIFWVEICSKTFAIICKVAWGEVERSAMEGIPKEDNATQVLMERCWLWT